MAEFQTDARDLILQRLQEDLMGPSGGPHERINERPTDRYLTGILYPQRMASGAEHDDTLAAGGGADADDTAADQVAMARMVRPASAGLSFAVSGKKPLLRFTISCATYADMADCDEAGASPPSPASAPQESRAELEADRPPGQTTAARPAGKKNAQLWQRVAHTLALEIDAQTVARCNLGLHGIAGLELAIKCAPRENEWLVTAVLVNRKTVGDGESRLASDAKSFFQVCLVVEPLGGVHILARPTRRAALDDDGRSAALLYRTALEFAVGHTCAADWEAAAGGSGASKVSTTWFPAAGVQATSSAGGEMFVQLKNGAQGSCFDAEVLAAESSDLALLLMPIPDAYESWIDQQEQRIPTLPVALQSQAVQHMQGCRACLNRMRSGIRHLAADENARTAFKLANRAMALQYRWSQRDASRLQWRPFQIGFLLLAVESVSIREHADRGVMDLLWFPTGGGKTEAYLALVAFCLFIRRFRHPHAPEYGAGTAAIMRYTMRLLTTQQFQRATSLILACELLRRQDGALANRLGATPFSIGLWVGKDAVPNTVRDALRALDENTPNRPDQVTHCPACANLLHWGPGPGNAYVKVECRTAACTLAGEELPVWTVDEDVYKRLPSLIIGTIDKFAQLPHNLKAGGMFGLRTQHDAPDLVLQDELHLISGPLGTLAGLYEAAIDELCARSGVRPKVIGSTATIRRASEQILALFNRSAQLFPPPGLDVMDSCFAVQDHVTPARRYAAVTTAGRSAKFTLQAVSASLLQSASHLAGHPHTADGYWTLVQYFNALRELGGALVLMQDDVPASINLFAARRGEQPRPVELVHELTSRLAQSELKDRLADLGRSMQSGGAIDVLLATNMLSVGIDIPRLGLMVMNGQPKAAAEYIQATSRVGRGGAPGLVVAIYNSAKARDRSRFETFRTWHETLYREVEATSVTPFSPRSRDRGLHAAIVIVARHLIPALYEKPLLGQSEAAVLELAQCLIRRAGDVEPEELDATRAQIEGLIEMWASRTNLETYGNDRKPNSSLMISAESAATRRALRRELGDAWPTPSSLRTVEPAVQVALVERLPVLVHEDHT